MDEIPGNPDILDEVVVEGDAGDETPAPEKVLTPDNLDESDTRAIISRVLLLPEARMRDVLRAILEASAASDDAGDEAAEKGVEEETAAEIIRHPALVSGAILQASAAMLRQWEHTKAMLDAQPKVTVVHAEVNPIPVTVNGYCWGYIHPGVPTEVPQTVAEIMTNRITLLQGVATHQRIMMDARRRGLTLREHLMIDPHARAAWGNYPVTPE